jgi:hypothetical protein
LGRDHSDGRIGTQIADFRRHGVFTP